MGPNRSKSRGRILPCIHVTGQNVLSKEGFQGGWFHTVLVQNILPTTLRTYNEL